ncbi:unnamed protein product [Rotaria sordida]|uniref:Uncharacterized protein n=1 Tax=Rotaria sordida TaxID=392033 RepID=A0A815G8U6_9BILA|nr:unnamed protein product [Rotaria sordida]CAF3754067.1 unnamed protein product [Rotaria sordida]
MYDNISSECNKTQRLSEAQRKTFLAISKLLIALREQLVSYPNEYFHGRGKYYKPAAILSAAFAEVLFLDSDSYIVRDPENLFVSDPMYLKFGALFYPDAFKSRQHPSLRKLFNTSCGEHEYELDSAAIVVDKKRVWKGLYMTKLMNDNHELFYKHVSGGDKDTFRFGFRCVNVKYYIVMIPCSTGAFNDTHFCG